MSTLVDSFARLLEVLTRMEIPYEVAGSVASSAHRIPRTTLDIDIVVDLKPEQIAAFADERRDEFYADAAMIREALEKGRAANVIHLESGWKFDLFPLRTDDYSRTEFGRRSFRDIRPDGGAAIKCAVASAEDTILRKLERYRASGQTSDRQWNDLRGLCATAKKQLDIGYLRRWANHLKVQDLLEQLLEECGVATREPDR